MPNPSFIEKVTLNASTDTATGTTVNVEGYKRIGFALLAADPKNGTCNITFEGTVDGTNWCALNMLIDNVTNTNSQQLTRVATKKLPATTTPVLLWLDNFIGLKAVRANAGVSSAGAYTVRVIASE